MINLYCLFVCPRVIKPNDVAMEDIRTWNSCKDGEVSPLNGEVCGIFVHQILQTGAGNWFSGRFIKLSD